jgi:hypothetical protein
LSATFPVSTQTPKRIVAGRADLGAGLPPAVLTDHDARGEIVVEPGAGAHHTPSASFLYAC